MYSKHYYRMEYYRPHIPLLFLKCLCQEGYIYNSKYRNAQRKKKKI